MDVADRRLAPMTEDTTKDEEAAMTTRCPKVCQLFVVLWSGGGIVGDDSKWQGRNKHDRQYADGMHYKKVNKRSCRWANNRRTEDKAVIGRHIQLLSRNLEGSMRASTIR